MVDGDHRYGAKLSQNEQQDKNEQATTSDSVDEKG
jgi:hypothetical protein